MFPLSRAFSLRIFGPVKVHVEEIQNASQCLYVCVCVCGGGGGGGRGGGGEGDQGGEGGGGSGRIISMQILFIGLTSAKTFF